MKNINKIIEEGEKQIEEVLIDWEGKSNPIMGAVRVSARKEKLVNILSSQQHKLLQSIVEEIEKTKLPVKVNGLIMPVKQYNNALDDIKAKLTINIKE
jgi:CYTH domain-containing protein